MLHKNNMTEAVRGKNREGSFEGLLLGTAVGDALGLPYEGLSRRRAGKWYRGGLRHRLMGHRGLCSDDTEHAWMTGQALLSASEDASVFARALAWRLRGWFICLPGGMGLATARACIRLWLGISPDKSGVYSAGNGPAMRAPLLGAFFAQKPDALRSMVRACTLLTHTDERAEEGAWVIAVAGACAMRFPDADICRQQFFDAVMPVLQGRELVEALKTVQAGLNEQISPQQLAALLRMDDGVSGYINCTVPAVIYGWLRHYGDYRATVGYLVGLGGDTDTTAAIAGGLAGITVGKSGIPVEWLDGVADWPASMDWLSRLAQQLQNKRDGGQWRNVGLFWPALPVRNLVFLAVILLHGFRRLLPPY